MYMFSKSLIDEYILKIALLPCKTKFSIPNLNLPVLDNTKPRYLKLAVVSKGWLS